MSLDKMLNFVYGIYADDDGSYNSQSLLRGDAAVDSLVAGGKLSAKDGATAKALGANMTDKQRKQQIGDMANTILSWAGLGGKDKKTP